MPLGESKLVTRYQELIIIKPQIHAFPSAWRGKCKVLLCRAIDTGSFGIEPSKQLKQDLAMTPTDIVNFRKGRAAELLLQDAFCDHGLDERVSTYIHDY